MKIRIYEKRPGAWHLDFRSEGARYRPYAGASKAEAERSAPEVLRRALAGPSTGLPAPSVPPKATVPAGPTILEAFKRTMRTREKWISSKDKRGLQGQADALVAYFGETFTLAQVTRAVVLKWREAMQKEEGKRKGSKLSNSTINHRLTMLSILLESYELAPHTVKHLSVVGNRRKRRTREEELQAVISWCLANHARKDATTLADLVQVGLHTTARKGELLALKWPDIYFEMGQLTFRDTKNGSSRAVPMTDTVKRILERRIGYGGDGPFTGASKWQLGALWNDARKALGLEDDTEFVFHVATRHEGASRLGDQGASAFQIKAMMGNTIQAADIYVKPAVESLRGLAEGINRAPSADSAGHQKPGQ